jgi:hypothetical protein
VWMSEELRICITEAALRGAAKRRVAARTAEVRTQFMVVVGRVVWTTRGDGREGRWW